jgi:hypothetical protein
MARRCMLKTNLHLDHVARQSGLARPREISLVLLSRIAARYSVAHLLSAAGSFGEHSESLLCPRDVR